jgi:hypothetical protein
VKVKEMSTKDRVLDALKKEGPEKAFDVCMNIMGFHAFLDKCHLALLNEPHKLYLYHERIACKTHEGGYAALWIALDWIRQELILDVNPIIKEVSPLPLEANEGNLLER